MGAYSYKIRVSPYDGFYVVGLCTHRVTGTSKNTGQYMVEVNAVNATQHEGVWRRVITEETRWYKFTLGQYNLVVHSEFESGSRSDRRAITRITEPNG